MNRSTTLTFQECNKLTEADAASEETMQITERLSGSHLSQDAILALTPGDRITVMRKLDKPGQWFVIDGRSERIGFLTTASAVAKALNAGYTFIYAVIVSVENSAEVRQRYAVKVQFELADEVWAPS